MLTEETIADVSNTELYALFATGLDDEIAFGVHPHRAARKIRRPDSQQLIVHDHDLRVDERRDLLRSRRGRVDEAQALVRVCGDQLSEHVVPKGAHRVPLEPAFALCGR